MTKRNPKQDGSNVWDCKPQSGLCPIGCNQCFYNRPDAFYVDIDKPHMPTLDEVGDGIMRVNSGHDSNIDRESCIAATDQYPKRFFNTSVPKFDFPAPVVFTANPKEEESAAIASTPPLFAGPPANIMFVRLRVSATNLKHVRLAIQDWTAWCVPVVLTFMAYYDAEPDVPDWPGKEVDGPCYVWKKRHTNSYWCPTSGFMRWAVKKLKTDGDRLVTMCGTPDSPWCRDCGNCERYYYQTVKHMAESV